MASSFSLLFIVLFLAPNLIQSQTIHSVRLLDLLIRDYTFRTFDEHLKTGVIQKIHLPSNFSGIIIETVRFRCGSLTRYGAKIGEFHLGIGVSIQPWSERVMFVRQKLGLNWTFLYYANYNLSGYQLVSPVLGLLAYNANEDDGPSNPYEMNIIATNQKPILISFSNATILRENNSSMQCASFASNGKVTLENQVSPYVCAARKQGHFGLVIESLKQQQQEQEENQDQDQGPVINRRKISSWKVAVGSVIGSAIGAFLLGLLLIAMLLKVKKKAMREEMERRAYEEEALQVSMVGHVRAPTASGTRTVPRIEHGYSHYPS